MSDEEAEFWISELLKSAGVDLTKRIIASQQLGALLGAFRTKLNAHSFCENCASDEKGRACMCQDNS